MRLKVRVELTIADLRDTPPLLGRMGGDAGSASRPGRPWVIIVCLGVAAVLWPATGSYGAGVVFAALALLLAFPVMLLIPVRLYILYVELPRAYRRKNLGAPRSLLLDDLGVHARGWDGEAVNQSWDDFQGYAEGPRGILLLLRSQPRPETVVRAADAGQALTRFHYLPSRSLSGSQTEELLDFLHRRFGSTPGGRTAAPGEILDAVEVVEEGVTARPPDPSAPVHHLHPTPPDPSPNPEARR
jgi:hypothetical protein